MRPSKRFLFGVCVFLTLTIFTFPFVNPVSAEESPSYPEVKLNLLYNAGVMIEALGMRIYIDPISLGYNYSQLDADIVLVTHPHGDHYDPSIINSLQKESTVNIFPENMSDAISTFDGIGVNPGDHVQVGPINITAFYMYTTAPAGYEPSHPREANWTSYIIDISGFTIFHAGDSKNIEEYKQLNDTINVALLPLGPGCQTMTGEEVVDACEVLWPDYFIPIHYTEGADDDFVTLYGPLIEYRTDAEVIHLSYFSSYIFNEVEITTPSISTTSSTMTTMTTTTNTSPNTEPIGFEPLIPLVVCSVAGIAVIGIVIILLRKR